MHQARVDISVIKRGRKLQNNATKTNLGGGEMRLIVHLEPSSRCQVHGLVTEPTHARESYAHCGERFWERFENIISRVRRVEKGGRSPDGNASGTSREPDDVDACYSSQRASDIGSWETLPSSYAVAISALCHHQDQFIAAEFSVDSCIRCCRRPIELWFAGNGEETRENEWKSRRIWESCWECSFFCEVFGKEREREVGCLGVWFCSSRPSALWSWDFGLSVSCGDLECRGV